MSLKNATIAAAALIAICVIVLSVDYGVARFREPGDETRITAMQQQVRTDASLAPKLEAEKKKITDARRARKTRINVFSILLIAAATGFLTGAKRLVAGKKITPARAPAQQTRVSLPHGAPKLKDCAAEIDLAFVDEIVAREGRSPEAAIPILQAIQEHYRYLPDEALQRVCATTKITPAQISGTSSFYSRFRRSPVGEHIVRVCHGTACHVSGARQITDELRRGLAIPEGADTDPSRTFTIEGKDDAISFEFTTDGKEKADEKNGRKMLSTVRWEGESLVFVTRFILVFGHPPQPR